MGCEEHALRSGRHARPVQCDSLDMTSLAGIRLTNRVTREVRFPAPPRRIDTRLTIGRSETAL
jgi:hypothetical protein